MIILIVDDEAGLRDALGEVLGLKHEVKTTSSGNEALSLMEKQEFDVVLTDHQMPGLTGLEFIKRGRMLSPNTSFVLMTAYGSVAQAVQAIQSGAEDYILKPFDLSDVRHRLSQIEEVRSFRLAKSLTKNLNNAQDLELAGNSQAIRKIKEFVQKVAGAPSPILVLGASGTGKEMVAKAIHQSGPRGDKPFIAVNCASLSENLFESELFGHEKGAFTGATEPKPGKFELARGGTLFLDELGEFPLSLQAKLLRVLQEKEFYRVGGTKLVKADVRVVAATNRNLKEMVNQGKFREDLYFRLNVLSVLLPHLCQRSEDILSLIEHFWNKFTGEFGKRVELHPSTVKLLTEYRFPGNVRELRNVLERLIVLSSDGAVLGPGCLPPEIAGISPIHNVVALPSKNGDIAIPAAGLAGAIDEYEARVMAKAMEQTGQNQAHAAELLKISRGALQYKLKKYGLYPRVKKAA